LLQVAVAVPEETWTTTVEVVVVLAVWYLNF
jgi:hypothetical protein